MKGRGHRPSTFLIVEDQELLASQIRKLMACCAGSRLARSRAEALELLSGPERFLGAVIDVSLDNGTAAPNAEGLEVLEEFRNRYPDTPAVVLSGRNDPHVTSRAMEQRALYRQKPAQPRAFVDFARWCIEEEGKRHGSDERVAHRFATDHGLSQKYAEVLLCCMRGLDRRATAKELSISVHTYDNYAHVLLRAGRERSLKTLALRLTRGAHGSHARAALRPVPHGSPVLAHPATTPDEQQGEDGERGPPVAPVTRGG